MTIASSLSISAGHGESDKPQQEYTPAGFADDLAWICGQLRVEKPVVVGHSMGGHVAFELARQHPDLPAAIVAVDSAIIPAQWVIDAVKQHMVTLRTSGYREGQKAWVGGFFFIVALVFVYRSFYGMRIPEENAGTDTTLVLPHDHRHE